MSFSYIWIEYESSCATCVTKAFCWCWCKMKISSVYNNCGFMTVPALRTTHTAKPQQSHYNHICFWMNLHVQNIRSYRCMATNHLFSLSIWFFFLTNMHTFAFIRLAPSTITAHCRLPISTQQHFSFCYQSLLNCSRLSHRNRTTLILISVCNRMPNRHIHTLYPYSGRAILNTYSTVLVKMFNSASSYIKRYRISMYQYVPIGTNFIPYWNPYKIARLINTRLCNFFYEN